MCPLISNPVPGARSTCARSIKTMVNVAHLQTYLNNQYFVPHSHPVKSLPTMSQSLPSSTTVLVVGAGPAGMACALSLWSSGVRDMVIVDAIKPGTDDNSSRAFAIHAATLEVRFRGHSVYQTYLPYTTTGAGSCWLRRYDGRTRDQSSHHELL